jgi:hypothetical protein
MESRMTTPGNSAKFFLLGAVLLAGCASYDGHGLIPGKSTAAEVAQLMGPPAERISAPGGDSVWFYPRGPAGRHTYAVRVAPDGVMRAIEQRLTVENLQKLVAGETTAGDVRALFGPPYRITRLDRQERDVWEYRMFNQVQIPYNLFVQYSADGIVREVLFLRDPSQDIPGPGRS